MEELLQQFHERRAALLPATGKRPNRYPDELRQIAVAYRGEALRRGVARGVMAASLGLSAATVESWGREQALATEKTPAPAPPRLRRIEVVDLPVPATTLCVIGPRGLRAEGLSIEQVAVLFERLAC
jgi:hypothetical protein